MDRCRSSARVQRADHAVIRVTQRRHDSRAGTITWLGRLWRVDALVVTTSSRRDPPPASQPSVPLPSTATRGRLRTPVLLYNSAHAYRLRGLLRPDALRASLREVVRRHEALRTTFVLRGDRPASSRVAIRPSRSSSMRSLPVHDLRSLLICECISVDSCSLKAGR